MDSPPVRPPDNISHNAQVQALWEIIRTDLLKGRNVSALVVRVESVLKVGRENYREGKLLSEYDWLADIEYADELHRLNVTWMQTITGNWEKLANFWRGLADRQSELSEKLSASGINVIDHKRGAVAIAALNALVSERGERFFTALVTAIFCALVGLAAITIANEQSERREYLGDHHMVGAGTGQPDRRARRLQRRAGAAVRAAVRHHAPVSTRTNGDVVEVTSEGVGDQ